MRVSYEVHRNEAQAYHVYVCLFVTDGGGGEGTEKHIACVYVRIFVTDGGRGEGTSILCACMYAYS